MIDLLQGIRVLDLTMLLASSATTKLADLGADVIRIEQPPGDYLREIPPIAPSVELGVMYLMLSRSKRSVGIDLRTEAGREIFLQLVESADVVVENARPGAWDERGLGYEVLRRRNPRLIYCAIPGFGASGPFQDLPSHGLNIDLLAGHFEVSRAHGLPQIAMKLPIGIQIGPMYAALGVLAALLDRQRSGLGRYLEVSLWDSAVAHNDAVAEALNGVPHDSQPWLGTDGSLGPLMNVYDTEDDQILFIAPIEQKFWHAFCRVLGRPEWAGRVSWEGHSVSFGTEDPRLRQDLAEVLRSRPIAEWMAACTAASVPVTPVLQPRELTTTSQFIGREMSLETDFGPEHQVAFLRSPILIRDQPFGINGLPPAFGEHTDEVLTEMGFSEVERSEMVTAGTIFVPS